MAMGIERVLRFAAARRRRLCLLDLAEAERLRALDWRGPVLLLEGCLRAARPGAVLAPEALARGAPPAQIDWLAAHKTHEPHRVFLKLNSGMNRLGFRPGASALPGRG